MAACNARVDARRATQEHRADGRPSWRTATNSVCSSSSISHRGQRRYVRANLARRMTAELAPEAWIVDDTGIRRAASRSALRASTRARWGASRTARSACRSPPLPMRRRARSTGGSIYPRNGTTSAPRQGACARPRAPRAEVAAGAGDDRPTARLGPAAAGVGALHAAMARSRRFARAWMTARSTTSFRSRPVRRLTRSMSGPSGRRGAAAGARRLSAIARRPARCASSCSQPAPMRPSR